MSLKTLFVSQSRSAALCLGKAQWFMNRLVNEYNKSFEDDLWTIEQVEADAESKPIEF